MSCASPKLSLISWACSLLCLAACAPADPIEPIGTQRAAQLSGGPGVSVYDFEVDGARVGAVLVTDGAFGGGYADQYEFWLWDPAATADIRDGDITDFTIKVSWRSDDWDAAAASTFESGTNGWTAFAIPRLFDLQSEPRWAWSYEPYERYAFEMVAPAWGAAQGDIRYYLEMDFQPGSDIPSMEWLVDADDIKTYYSSEDSDEDADEDSDEGNDEGGGSNWTLPPEAAADATRWEVRLTEDTTLTRVSLAWAYELTTTYPPQ